MQVSETLQRRILPTEALLHVEKSSVQSHVYKVFRKAAFKYTAMLRNGMQ